MRPRSASDPQPWWRHGLVWLVLAFPLAAVVAGTVTAAIAVHGADPEVLRAVDAERSVRAKDPAAPALRARNHVNTPAAGQP